MTDKCKRTFGKNKWCSWFNLIISDFLLIHSELLLILFTYHIQIQRILSLVNIDRRVPNSSFKISIPLQSIRIFYFYNIISTVEYENEPVLRLTREIITKSTLPLVLCNIPEWIYCQQIFMIATNLSTASKYKLLKLRWLLWLISFVNTLLQWSIQNSTQN